MQTVVRLAISALALTMPLSAVQAQDFAQAEQELELVGEARPACVTRIPSAASGVNASFNPTSANGGELRIIQLVDASTAEPVPTAITLSVPVVCNASHRIALHSRNGGLLRERGNASNRQSPNSFADFVTYRVGLDWAGKSRQGSSDNFRNMAIDAARGAVGDATISFSLAGGGGPLVAGRYSDAIIIEFQPAS